MGNKENVLADAQAKIHRLSTRIVASARANGVLTADDREMVCLAESAMTDLMTYSVGQWIGDYIGKGGRGTYYANQRLAAIGLKIVDLTAEREAREKVTSLDDYRNGNAG